MKKGILVLLLLWITAPTLQAQEDDLALYCAKIVQEKDFNKSVVYKSPPTNEIVFSRFMKKGKPIYMVHLKKIERLKEAGYGATILLENGIRIHKHLKVSIRITDDKEFEHYVHFVLEDADRELLKNNLITDVVLHKISFVVQKPEKYQAYLKCIEQMP